MSKEIAGYQFVEIKEEYREYVFPGGNVVTIDSPVLLHVKRKPTGDAHRLIDASGMSHYVPAGWIHLRWKVPSGEPEFLVQSPVNFVNCTASCSGQLTTQPILSYRPVR